jgi:hypothetical protein
MKVAANDRDEFDELVRHPKYACIVADLVADVNLCDDSGGDRNKLDESEIEEWFEGLK